MRISEHNLPVAWVTALYGYPPQLPNVHTPAALLRTYRIHAKIFPPYGPGILPGGGNFGGGGSFCLEIWLRRI